MKLLSDIYPNHKWDKEKLFGRQKKSSQWRLYKTLQEIFPPGVEILEEYQLPVLLETGNLMTFDIYVPSLNIMVEYHGYQHYNDHIMFGDVKSHLDRDKQDEQLVLITTLAI